MDNLITFNEIGITYTSKKLGPRIISAQHVCFLRLTI